MNELEPKNEPEKHRPARTRASTIAPGAKQLVLLPELGGGLLLETRPALGRRGRSIHPRDVVFDVATAIPSDRDAEGHRRRLSRSQMVLCRLGHAEDYRCGRLFLLRVDQK